MIPREPARLALTPLLGLALALAPPQLLAMDTEEPAAAAARVERLLAEGRAGEGLLLVRTALGSDPRSRTLNHLEARCLFESGLYPDCEAALDRLLAAPDLSSGERGPLLLRLAEARLAEDDLEGAVAAAGEALASPGGEGRQGAVGGIYFRAHRYAAALPLLDRALAASPGDALLLFSRGAARARTGLFADAAADLRAAAADPGLRVEARFELGLVEGKLGEHRRAVETLLLALEEDPFESQAVYQLAQELLRLRRPAPAGHLHRYFRALKDAEGVSSRDHHLAALGKPVEAALERARRWERMGRLEKAIEEHDRLARAGGGPLAAREAAQFWLRMGLPAEARREIREGRESAAAPLLTLAREARDLGRAEEAYRRVRLAVALAPRSAEALREAAEAHRDPSEVLVRLHYLNRLQALRPEEPHLREAIDEARRPFEEGR